jgi:hypothetical protein|tara:strand:+ start:31 stop:369 length:339 start_codon:yes stop_codon:yes gene_type:complete
MINDWNDSDPDDGFNPQDHDIEMDEIAKMYAMADMKEEQKTWARKQAEKFYSDFENLSVKEAVFAVKSLIKTKSVTITESNTLLDNMIQVFQDDEEYEKCHICLQIKKGINA